MVFFHSSALPRSLYLHYPICQHICSYCDFNVYSRQRAGKVFPKNFDRLWAEALGRQLSNLFPTKLSLRSLYFGGGTPGLLEPVSLERLLEKIEDHADFSPAMEFSLELNPENISQRHLAAIKALGVNRPSLGVQSLVGGELKRLERLSTFNTVLSSMELVAENFENFSFDLMIGIPEQSLETLELSLNKLLEFDPPHISIYMLTLKPDHKWYRSSVISSRLPDEDDSAKFYRFVCDRLRAEGYEHYELSNFAKPSFFSRHNSWYWLPDYSYAGLGPGAHAYDAGSATRYEMLQDPMAWEKSLTGISSQESLSAEQQKLEDFYLRLRTRRPLPVSDKNRRVVERLACQGHLELFNDFYVISEPSWVLMESLASQLVRGI